MTPLFRSAEKMAIQLQKGSLNDACRRIAEAALWTPTGTSSDIVETLAGQLQDIAERDVEFIVGQQRDPNIIRHAVHYIADVHLPPTNATSCTQWFKIVLSCLIELAVPNSVPTTTALPFFKEMRRGIEIAEADAESQNYD